MPLKVADIGYGTGASTLVPARLLNAQVTAVDFLQDFLDVLETRAEIKGLADKIATLSCPMDELPFGDEEYDVNWSEGAIYSIGFERGVKDWSRCLKSRRNTGCYGNFLDNVITPGRDSGILGKRVPGNFHSIVKDGWAGKKNGYSPIGYFVLPEHCWLENYYQPIHDSISDFLIRNAKVKRL